MVSMTIKKAQLRSLSLLLDKLNAESKAEEFVLSANSFHGFLHISEASIPILCTWTIKRDGTINKNAF